MIKVLIADDHKIFVDGLISLLTREHNISVVAKAHNGIEMLDCLENYDVDIVLSDINMPVMDGLKAAKIILKKFPNVKVIMLSMHNRNAIIKEVVKIGVHGYVLKSGDNAELVNTINKVFTGERYYSFEVKKILDNIADNKKHFDDILISKKEQRIIKHICDGFTSKEIADILNLSIYTVETHRKNLLIKTKSKNVVALVNYAYKNNIVDYSVNS
ncbi:MAG: response regulator transcription factor [Bacteroidales bacterium]|nr:response regulator transcription factor [Bacteroidales bacterium]